MLSNHAIVALGILTRRAKHTAGVIKAADILNNHQQAYTLLVQAILSGEQEIISLTLELNKTLQIAPNLISALAMYIAEIQDNETLAHSSAKERTALNTLSQHLYDTTSYSDTYRQASEAFLSKAKKPDYPFYCNLIRSFYPFWVNSHRFTKAGNKKSSSNAEQKQDLMDMWNCLENTFLTAIEESLLTAYKIAIKEINIPTDQVELRINIAKLIMVKQRPFEQTPKGYRENIEGLKNSLTSEGFSTYFLSVAREFYVVWQNSMLSTQQAKH